MKLKLDENLGERGAELFRAAGHDVMTVAGQRMSSATDESLVAACHAEERCLITLDMDFSNPIRFPPQLYSGIAVLRLPSKPTADDLWACCRMLIAGLDGNTITGKLWIVQRGKLREYQPLIPDE